MTNKYGSIRFMIQFLICLKSYLVTYLVHQSRRYIQHRIFYLHLHAFHLDLRIACVPSYPGNFLLGYWARLFFFQAFSLWIVLVDYQQTEVNKDGLENKMSPMLFTTICIQRLKGISFITENCNRKIILGKRKILRKKQSKRALLLLV